MKSILKVYSEAGTTGYCIAVAAVIAQEQDDRVSLRHVSAPMLAALLKYIINRQ